MNYLLLFLGGLLGSAHCLGMCGGFPMGLAAESSSWRDNLMRQTAYSVGRLAAYGWAGAMVGYAGLRLLGSSSWIPQMQGSLALVAGAILLYQGLLSAGWIRRQQKPHGGLPCLMSQLFVDLRAAIPAADGTSRKGPSTRQALVRSFSLGMLTALMPCGLLYGYLLLAAASGGPLLGAAVMLAFGLGTVPWMQSLGLGFRVLSLSARGRVLRIAAYCVMFTGLVSMVRGVQAWRTPESGACPLCAARGELAP